MCLVCFVTYVPGLHPDADQHGLRAVELPEAPSGAGVCRPAQLRAAFLGVAAGALGHRRAAGDGAADDVDGARRLETRRRSAAGRGATRLGAAATPNLNSRMLVRGRAIARNLNSQMLRRRTPDDVTNRERGRLGRAGEVDRHGHRGAAH